MLTNGFQPLAYATIRYACATILFWGFTYARERSFRIALRDMRLVLLAALFIFCNQVCFIYAVDKTSAATVTLFLGSTPIFIGILASVIGLERMGRGFWIATIVSLIGVGFVASGSGGFSGRLIGDGLAVLTAVTWAGYSVLITPLDAALLAVPDQFARAGLRLDPARARRPAADHEPDLSVRHADVDLPGVRSDRPAVSDEHPVVHRDQPSRSVATIVWSSAASSSVTISPA